MRLSTAKDILIKSFVNRGEDYKNKVDKHTEQAALNELAKDEYITVIEVTVEAKGNLRSYIFQSLYPKAVHFVNSKQSFRRAAILKWIADMPKNYWFLGSFILLVASQSTMLVQLFSKGKTEKSKIELQVRRGIKSDTITVYQK